MKKQRGKHTPEFKARFVQEYEIHPVMVINWKKEMFSHLPDVFDKSKRPKTDKDHGKRKIAVIT